MFRTDNPLADFDQWEWEKEKQLRKRPKCDRCKGYIQDEYLYEVMGELYCEDCMNKHFRKASEDYEN